MIYAKLSSWNLSHKRVFLRADLNVPLAHGEISNDFRLKSILPTLNFLLSRNAQIILSTHLGRPHNKEPELSTQILIPWFQKQGYNIAFIDDFNIIRRMPIVSNQILLIENLRFFPGEKTNDPFFSKQLSHIADYYINDAFGVLHTYDCSIASLPYEFSENKRSIGFLVEKELSILKEVKDNPQRPFLAILGGSKIKDKIPLITHLVNKVDILLIYPALCFSFLKALDRPIGKSLIDNSVLEVCKEIITQAENCNTYYSFPIDYQVTYNDTDGPLDIVKSSQFPENAIGISIGPETLKKCITLINEAKTIFLNCAMGFADRPETRYSTYDIICAMEKSSAKTVIAGGDSISSALHTTHYSHITHLSTGGGAALAYLSDTLLPGLTPFEEEEH